MLPVRVIVHVSVEHVKNIGNIVVGIGQTPLCLAVFFHKMSCMSWWFCLESEPALKLLVHPKEGMLFHSTVRWQQCLIANSRPAIP